MSRKIILLAVAFVLICLTMVIAAVFALIGTVTAQKFSGEVVWSKPFASTESMKVMNVLGDSQGELFIQSPTNVFIYDGNGAVLLSQVYRYPKTALGDVNDDGIEDIIVYYLGDFGYSVDVIANGQKRTIADSLSIGLPACVALSHFSSGSQIVLGDISGHILALSREGLPLWESNLGSSEVRGLDDAKISGQTDLVAATSDGDIAMYGAQGNQVWSHTQEQLRSLRAVDLNSDGNSEIITGGEYGAFIIYSAADGGTVFNTTLGQDVSEVRAVELNGDPSSHEIVIGGKDGGVWAFSNTGNQLWSGSLSDKVTEISGIDINGDGKEEAVIGADSGEVAVFTENGLRNNLSTHNTGITRIDFGKLGKERYIVIADGTTVQIEKVNFSSTPRFPYTPVIVCIIVSGIILAIAVILVSIPRKPEMKISSQNTSHESLEA